MSQILSLLTEPSGSFVYHLVLVFSIAGALLLSFNHWRSSGFPQARRAMQGLIMLLLGQLFLFIFSAIYRPGIIDPSISLPPLDRALSLFSIIWITWLWAFPEPSRTGDRAALILSLLVAAGAGIDLLSRLQQTPIPAYNATFNDLTWQIASLVFIAFSAFILIIRRPNGLWNGIIMLSVAFLGHVGHLLFHPAGNYSGSLRLAYLAVYPILITLPQRFTAPVIPAPPAALSAQQEEAPVQHERRRYSTDFKTFHALMALATESNPDKTNQAITHAVARTMLSDLCYLVYLTDNNNQLMIAAGYDLIREDVLEGGSLNKNAIPMLATALQRGRPLRLPASSTSADIKGLGDILGLTNPGHLMSVPIITPEQGTLGGLMLLSPYSDRVWTADDQAFLTNIAASLVPFIQRSQTMTGLEQQGEDSRNLIEDLERRNLELKQQLEALDRQSHQEGVKTDELIAWRAAQEEAQHTIEQLQNENADLRAKSPVSSVGSRQLEQELKASLEEVAHLQNLLAESDLKAITPEKARTGDQAVDQAEVIASLAQELRQPMSSIVGYTELLLGETVGILGALQRKFVERVKASTERIGSLIDDMIQVTNMEIGLAGGKTEAVDLNTIIDSAMSYTSSQVREKNISMHLDLPKKIAPIHADREALQQILIHLLQNAGAASPVEGVITLTVQTRHEDSQEYILIQVADTGGGILSEDLPRVFTRLYRADNVLIQGVGDTGVGLSIAKTLTEAQHGRIWVESQMGIGSTFSVLLPISRGDGDNPMKSKGMK
jgi:signal transduction histidine kinase